MKDNMKRFQTYILIITVFIFASCENKWDQHYSIDDSYFDRTIWEELSSNMEYSQFKGYIEEFGLEGYFHNSDTLISTKTIFLPTNSAFQSFTGNNNEISASLILYHLIKSNFLLSNIEGNLKSQAQNLKFLYFEEYDGSYSVDGIDISALPDRFIDGTIYQMDEVIVPKQSIAEYIEENAEYFSYYIGSFDTIVMDYSNSEIIEIDYENDFVIYDSVYTVYNEFKSMYFDVDRNTRDTFATMLLYTDEQFYAALDVVADDLGYPSGEDLPYKWIKEVYFEYYLKTTFFDGLLTYNDLSQEFVVNINNDTVAIDHSNLDPEQVICSNGLIYHYYDLIIPEELYKSEAITEGESLVEFDVDGKLKLIDGVRTTYYGASDELLDLTGKINYVLGVAGIASNDSAIQISIGSNFSGIFELEVPIYNVFPGRYILDWAGFGSVTGVFKVYVNDSLLYTRLPFEPVSDPGSLMTDFDTYNFGSFALDDITMHEDGIDWGKLRASESLWNINEFYVERDPADPAEFYLKEFGDVRVKFEFLEFSPSNSNNTGIVIDYLKMRQR